MSYQTFQITQPPTWACPNMLIFVKNGKIIGNQQNPNNKLTQSWANDWEDWGEFDPSEYLTCVEIK